MFWEILIVSGLILISIGFFLYRKAKAQQGYMRIHMEEDVEKAREGIDQKEDNKKEGYTNLFSNIFSNPPNEKIERKVKKLQEKKKKKWQPMGLFGG